MLAVILLHCINTFYNEPVYLGTRSWYFFGVINELTRAGVPLFFMISGYLALDGADCGTGEYYRRRLPRIAVPLVCWSAVYYIADVMFSKQPFSVAELFSELLDNGSEYHLWFMYTMLGLTLLAPFLKKIVRASDETELFVLLAIIMFPTALRPIINTYTPVYIYIFAPLVEGYTGYYLLGYILGRYSFSRRGAGIIYTLGVTGFAVGYIGNWFGMRVGAGYFWNGGFALNHYLTAAALFLLFKRHYNGRLTGKAASLFAELSFGMYLSHVLFCKLFTHVVAYGTLTPIAYAGLEFIFTVGCSAAVALVPVLIRRLCRSNKVAA